AGQRDTQAMAQRREDECRKIRDGLVDPAERTRREATGRPIADHVRDFRRVLEAKGDGEGQCDQVVSRLLRLFASAGVRTLPDLTIDRVREGLRLLRESGRKARTLNAARSAVRMFALWLEESDRVERVPKGLLKIESAREESDRLFTRRHLTKEEIDRLLAVSTP